MNEPIPADSEDFSLLEAETAEVTTSEADFQSKCRGFMGAGSANIALRRWDHIHYVRVSSVGAGVRTFRLPWLT